VLGADAGTIISVIASEAWRSAYYFLFAGDLRSNRVLGADAGTIISIIVSVAWRSAFAQ